VAPAANARWTASTSSLAVITMTDVATPPGRIRIRRQTS
jgi:hypothetical protein